MEDFTFTLTRKFINFNKYGVTQLKNEHGRMLQKHKETKKRRAKNKTARRQRRK